MRLRRYRTRRAGLAAAWVAAISAAPASASDDPILHWRFDRTQLQGTTFTPVAGVHPLQCSAAPSFVGEGAALSLVQPAESFRVAAPQRVSPSTLPSKQITVAAWVAVDRVQAWGGILCAIEDNGEHERGWILGTRQQNFIFAVSTEGRARLDYMPAPAPFRVGRWYHVVGTYDGKLVRLYVNGMEMARSSEHSGKILYDEDHLLAAGSYLDLNENYPTPGALHDLRVWDVALSEKAIRKLAAEYADGLPAPDGETFSGLAAPSSTPLSDLQPRIDAAIDRGVEHLLLRQNRDGSWNERLDVYRNGGTSLTLYAMLESGLPRSHPSVSLATRFLAARDPQRVYSYGCQLLALGELADPEHEEWVERLVTQLRELESDAQPGSWAYPSGSVDISNTQFAALGFFGASKLGVEVPSATWRRMVEKTVDHHQPKLRDVPWLDEDAEGTAAQRTIGGYTYYAGGGTYPESGSMTTAGLCILALGERLAGDQLGRTLRRKMEGSRQAAMNWLIQHYTVSTNPGYPSTTYYYLYGLERVCALFELDRVGHHDWYRDGAEWLVGEQDSDGGWGRMDETAFALLFLTKATAASTGGRRPDAQRFAWSDDTGEVRVRATGPSTLTAWVSGFSEELREEFGELRVARVRYLVDGEEIASVEADPSAPWTGERFAIQHDFPEPRERELKVLVELQEPADEDDKEPAVHEVGSKPIRFQLRPDNRAWMDSNLARPAHTNLVPQIVESVEASSVEGSHTADRAHDGFHGLGWLAQSDDATPTLRYEFTRPTRCEGMRLYPFDATLLARGHSGRATKVEVLLNRKSVDTFEANEDPLAPIEIDFGKSRRVKQLEIRVLESAAGSERANVGIGELVLYRQR